MKKSFWGYDIRETDEVLDSLRSQNDILASKVTKLHMELSALQEKAQAPVTPDADDPAAREQRQERETLRQQKQQLEEEMSRLRAEWAADTARRDEEAALLRAELEQAKANRGTQREVENIGQIYLKAYEDMEQMRADVAADVDAQVEEYAGLIQETNRQMQEAMAALCEAKEETVRQLVESYEQMLENLEAFAKSGQALEEQLPVLGTIQNRLLLKKEAMMKRSRNTAKGYVPSEILPEVEPQPEPETPESTGLPPLLFRAIQETHRRRPALEEAATPAKETPEEAKTDTESLESPANLPAEERPTEERSAVGAAPLIINTHVKAKDVFGKR